MRILLVEDESAFRDQVVSALDRIPGAEIVHAASLESAIEALDRDVFDLVLCDLKIPPQDGGLDTAEDHGFEVHQYLRTEIPGTASIIFTGYATASNVRDSLSSAPVVDLFGSGETISMTRLRTKAELRECVQDVKAFAAELRKLDDIQIDRVDGQLLGLDAMRTLRIMARRMSGQRVDCKPLGGLSGATTLLLQVFNEEGVRVSSLFGKVGLQQDAARELETYAKFIPKMLPLGSFPPLAEEVLYGAGRHSGVFYTLADEASQGLFGVCTDPVLGAKMVQLTAGHTEPWKATNSTEEISVGDLRRQRLSDQQFDLYRNQINGVVTFEARSTEMKFELQHSDLHGSNILVTDAAAVLIDFADVQMAPVGYDPLTLELSLVFHPDSPIFGDDWPTVRQCSHWFDLDMFVDGCPAAEYVRACRRWALTSQPDTTLLAFVLYAHALRQLKYPGTDTAKAIALANAAVAAIGLDGQ